MISYLDIINEAAEIYAKHSSKLKHYRKNPALCGQTVRPKMLGVELPYAGTLVGNQSET